MLHRTANDQPQLLLRNSLWLCWRNQYSILSSELRRHYKIILAQEREDNIARQRSSISGEMFTALLDQAKESTANSLKTVVTYWFTLIRIKGLCCAEYAQNNQSAFDEHKYPSGKRVVKAFIPSDWKFHYSKGPVINHGKSKGFSTKLKITFRIQKNRQNGQSITLVADNDHVNICPV